MIWMFWDRQTTNGLIRAQFYLATCYDHGHGTKKDLQLAFDWYLKAANAGHSDSQYNVGFFFGHNELGIENHKKKVYWYTKAAIAGLPDAQRDLGYSYFYGEGVKKDNDKAIFWYKKAANKNDDKAIYNLGLCYKHGDGVTKSKRWAKYYFLKADKLGHKLAKGQLKQLDKK